MSHSLEEIWAICRRLDSAYNDQLERTARGPKRGRVRAENRAGAALLVTADPQADDLLGRCRQ